jgi:alkanesulfonate monooxygenase SsuD/methylene tetrahydromethanopterin reductase-like flavin-dependent oxidoreductase (luciferase family)
MAIHISVELSHICPFDEITTHATALEANGFHRVWIPDTVVSPWEAWLAASLIMQQTTSLQIGLGVTNPYTRHPVVVAQMAATMQQYSGGRLAISLGRGIGRFLEKAGIKQHIKAVEECVHVLRGLIAGERTSFSGDVFQIDAMKLRTPPPDTPVPIYLAAVGPAGWDSAIRVADGVATFYSDKIAETRRQFMTERIIPAAVLIPFSLSRTDFFESRVTSIDGLRQRIAILEETGFDEVIIAYGDIKDLEASAQLLGASV